MNVDKLWICTSAEEQTALMEERSATSQGLEHLSEELSKTLEDHRILKK